MKKLFSVMMVAVVMGAMALSTGFIATPCALANEIVSMDKQIPSYSVVTQDMSKAYASTPVWLNVWGAYPTNGTVTVAFQHVDAGGVVRTTTLIPAWQIAEGGVLSTNLTYLMKRYVQRDEPVVVTFSAATNGYFQLIGELYK